MVTVGTRNGYTRVLTADPDEVDILEASGNYGGIKHGPHIDRDVGMKLNNPRATVKSKKKLPLPPSRPGLFYMFGERGKYAANHISVAIASQSESEQEAEKIELTEFKSKKPKFRRARIGSGSSGVVRSPKISKSRSKFKFSAVEPLLPGDTLQRVALRYNCQTSEIRRLNNLYSDQDFFALKTVKIPVREHGILTEPEAREKCRKNNVDEPYHSSGGATSDELRLGGPNAYYKSDDDEYEGSSVEADDEVEYDSDSLEVRDVSIHSALKWKHSQHTLLKKFGEELERVRENTEQRLANLNEVALTMTTPTILPIVPQTNDSFEKRLFLMNFDSRIVVAAVIVVCGTLIFCIVGYLVLSIKGQI